MNLTILRLLSLNLLPRRSFFSNGLGNTICMFVGIATTLAVLGSAVSCAQSNEWGWMGGSHNCNPYCDGVYGTLGVPSTANIPSGRVGPVSWVDQSGDLWLFGGWGVPVGTTFEDQLDDLWQYNPSSKEWAWMGGTYPYMGQPGVYGTRGTPAAGNMPGSREFAVTWTDSNGNFWLFGGEGYDASLTYSWLNDLWKFNPSTNEWTWISGSSTVTPAQGNLAGGQPGIYGTLQTAAASNVPGGRWGASGWIDGKGNLWLFGGSGFDANGETGDLNDLWQFNPSTGEWTWMSGSSTTMVTQFSNGSGSSGQPGTYGTIRVPAAGNAPGGRDSAASWIDQSGNLWLFGGEGVDSLGGGGPLNDLWEFDPTTYEWTWIGGSATAGSPAVYGKPQNPDVGNIPSGGAGVTAWVDRNHKVWVFGGGTANDLWAFDPVAFEWAWMSGSQWSTGTAVYGTLGVPAAGNLPSGRSYTANWVDKNGDLWLFGGSHITSYLGDLWEYVTPSAPSPVPSFAEYASPASLKLALGTNGTSTITTVLGDGFNAPISFTATGEPTGVTVSFSPSTIPAGGSSQMAITVDSIPDPGTYEISVSGTGGSTTQKMEIPLEVVTSPPFTLGISPAQINVPTGGQGKVTVTSTAQSNFSSPITLSASHLSTGFSVSFNPATIIGTGTSQATISAPPTAPVGDYYITISGTSGSVTQNSTVEVTAAPAPPSFTVAASPSNINVNSGSQATATLTLTPQNGFNSATTFACSGLPSGVTCAFNPTTVTPSGGANATTTLTLAASASAAMRRQSHPWLPVGALSLAGLLLWWRPQRKTGVWLTVLTASLGLSVLSACGGGGASSGGAGGGSGGGSSPTPTTSTITVTGTSGSLQASTTLALTLN